ncbi:hypothetical protein P5673_033619 [Acropora cervicornis]|uniref:Uncharacterized protein n=1 Tax=Acropora cervicornis TaxID=6130 RepID=A0AAD9PPQ4_ACRCE|nr:hypothetical protein P5673_033619 [Acropora cervicornis]
MQEMGRAGRDGKYSKALLLFHGRQLRQCKPEMLDYVKSNSCRRRKLVDFFEDKGQGILTEKKHLCCDVCTLECQGEEDYPQNNGSMLSKISLSNNGGDISKVRSVNEDERTALGVLLKECQEKMQLEILKSNHHCFFADIDQITCFSNSISDDTVSKCELVFSVDDIIEKVPVLSVQHAFKVYDCLHRVFTNVQEQIRDE